MHKRRPNFDPLKFTPARIHNKIELDKNTVITYFLAGHPLPDCAKQFGCSQQTIKRKLRSWGIDTSIYNHSDVAAQRSRDSHGKMIPSDDQIRLLYIDQNLDTKTIAEAAGLHYQTIRTRIQRMGLKKSRNKVVQSMMSRYMLKHGYHHPAQHPDTLKKTRRSTIRIKYTSKCGLECTFRSLHELSYALYLDTQNVEWMYEEMRILYVDMLTGKHRTYIIDFTILGEQIEWVEVKPNELMIPEDKRIYAERRAEEAGVLYRGTTADERSQGWRLLLSGCRFQYIKFLYPLPRRDQNKITYWFKSELEADAFTIPGWRLFTKITKEGCIYKKTMVRQ